MGTAIVVFIVLLVGGLAVKVWFDATRERRMREFAGRLGGRMFPNDPHGLTFKYGQRFPTLDQGEMRKAYNVVTARAKGREIFCFDHWHEVTVHTENGPRKSRVHRTCVVVEARVDLDCMEIRPRRLLDSVKRMFGGAEVQAGPPAFRKRYFVAADDEALARAVLDDRMTSFLMEQKDFACSIFGETLFIVSSKRRFSPARIERELERALAFLDRVPRRVREARGATASSSARTSPRAGSRSPTPPPGRGPLRPRTRSTTGGR